MEGCIERMSMGGCGSYYFPIDAYASLRGCELLSIPGGVDFMDSDKSYAVSEVKAPLAPPIKPPYEAGIAKAKEANAAVSGTNG